MGRLLQVILYGLAMAASGSSPDGQCYLVVRYDDYPPTLEYTAGRDTPTVEARLFDLFARYDAKLVVGVVPFPIADMQGPGRDPRHTQISESWLTRPTDAWVRLLRTFVQRGTIEAAVHGFEHRLRTPKGCRPGEFRGQSADWQIDAIRLGRDALAEATGQPVRVFVPPWNAWDDNTALALDQLGFTWCSADFLPVSHRNTQVRFLPQCYWEPEQVLELLQLGKEIPRDSVLVLVLHPFDFNGDRAEGRFHALEELLNFVRSTPDWVCVSFSSFSGLPQGTSAAWDQRYRQAIKWQEMQVMAHNAYGPGKLAAASPLLVRPAHWYATRLWRWQLLVLLTLVFSAVLSYLIVRVAFGVMPLPARWRLALALAATAGILVLILGAVRLHACGYPIRGVRWQAISASIGAAAALWILRSKPRRLADIQNGGHD